jgi:pilus assembly protein CpaC
MPSIIHGSLGVILLLQAPGAQARAAQATTVPPSAAPLVSASAPGSSPASSAAGLSVQFGAAADVLHVPVGRSVVLTAAAPLRRLYVGNPAVIQSYTSGQTEVVITAKAPGISSIVLWDTAGGHRLYTVSADVDAEALRSALQDAFPASDLHVESSGGKIVLSGTAPTEAVSEAAFKLISLYGKDVVNSIRVQPVRAKQVQLKLRIVEVDRTRLEQMGINFFSGGKNYSQTSTQQYSSSTNITTTPTSTNFTITNPLQLLFYNSSLNVGVNIEDLEQKQILQVLAEPTLTTISGTPARFLSGGEFPFPIVQGGTGSATAVTITFKPYGVKVDFTPTVNPDGSIHLKVDPEVSALDYSNSVTISGFTIPALSTRRAETEVEIKDGQSFIVSGLLDHRVTDNLNKVPGFGDLPLLGQVFRSKSLQHSVIELVVVVTAKVVDPLSDTSVPVEPQMAVPYLNGSKFDSQVHSEWKTGDPAEPKADHE